MKTKIVCVLVAATLVALTAWLVNLPSSSQADEIPEKYRGTVAKGLEYLVKNQHRDGHWEGDDGKHPVAMTGLVGIALLMEGARPNERFASETILKRKYSAEIRKAADWLVEKSKANRDGLIFSEHASETPRYMQGHGLATLFLAGALWDEKDEARRKKLTDALNRAVRYMGKAQSSQGGWYLTSKVEGHDLAEITTTVIQIQALQAVLNAGFGAVDDGVTVIHAHEYLTRALAKYEEQAKPEKNYKRQRETAAALMCRFHGFTNGDLVSKDEAHDKWLKYCRSEIAVGPNLQFGRDELTHYFYAQAVFFREDGWKDYRTAMFDQLLASQKKDGSWGAGDGIGVGAVYSTAVWCTILQLDNKCHPASLFEVRKVSRVLNLRRVTEEWS